MEYIYGALLLHSAGREVNEDDLQKVLSATGEDVEDARVKALVAALEDIDMDEAIEKAAAAPAAAPAAPAEDAGAEEAEEEEDEEEEDEGKSEEEAAEGLSGLFD